MVGCLGRQEVRAMTPTRSRLPARCREQEMGKEQGQPSTNPPGERDKHLNSVNLIPRALELFHKLCVHAHSGQSTRV